MKVQVIEMACTAKVGLAIEFSNSECASIEKVADKLNTTIEEKVKTAAKAQKTSLENDVEGIVMPLQADELFIHIDLETAMRISWLLGNFVRNNDSGLFNTADNMCLETMAQINQKSNELNPATKAEFG